MSEGLGFIQKLTRLYTFYSPLRKGKYRLALASLSLADKLPERVSVRTTDGRTLNVNFDDHLSQLMFFLGEYERAITEAIRKMVNPGDICLDIGANIGWYTTLLQSLAGPDGEVHSFEPVPSTFETLRANVATNPHADSVRLNSMALGDENRDAVIHTFGNLSAGHASISDFGDSDSVEITVPMKRLDDYLVENRVGDVKFVKIDIEGAELSMLKGASRLFAQDIPPLIVIEAALETTRPFGYFPDDLVRFIGKQSDYDFYEFVEAADRLDKIDGFERESIGANVLCIPQGHFGGERKALGIS